MKIKFTKNGQELHDDTINTEMRHLRMLWCGSNAWMLNPNEVLTLDRLERIQTKVYNIAIGYAASVTISFE